MEFDLSLARGPSYYTGNHLQKWFRDADGSILGGGRYDDLTWHLRPAEHEWVGISFGPEQDTAIFSTN